MKNMRKYIAALVLVLISALFVSCGNNPVSGKTYSMELFGIEIANYEFKSNGTYVVSSTMVDEQEVGNWSFKNNVLTMNPGLVSELEFTYNPSDKTLSATEGMVTITLTQK